MIKKKIVKPFIEKIFKNVLKRKKKNLPVFNEKYDVKEKYIKSKDRSRIYSWRLKVKDFPLNGTIFMIHGFDNRSFEEGLVNRGKEFAKNGFLVVFLDLRHHGNSSNSVPTFGKAESWDIDSVINNANKKKYPKPFILMGESLGAMGAQVSTILNPEVDALIALNPPGWPKDAIGKVKPKIQQYLNDLIKKKIPFYPGFSFIKTSHLCNFINAAYPEEKDILHKGDIRNYNTNPVHRPLILYIMGTKDQYDINKTHQIWDHWYKGYPANYNSWPKSTDDQSKWFLEVPGAEHSDGRYTIYHWDKFNTLINDFLKIVIERKSK